jgi:hypothetical protein
VKCSRVKRSEGLSNRVSNTITITRYIDHKKFAADMAFSFITHFHVILVPFLSLYIWFVFCMLLFNFVNYIFLLLRYLFLLLCMFSSWYSVSLCFFCVLFVCKCVLYYCHRVSTELQLRNIYFYTYLLTYSMEQGPS